MRVTGLATGMDTDTMVKQMLIPYQTKVDRAKQSKDVMAIKQQLYRDVTKDLNDLYKKYFDLTSSTSLVMSSTYKTSIFKSSSDAISAVGLAGGKVGNYKVDIKEKADSARISLDKQALDSLGDKFEISVNGEEFAKGKLVEIDLTGIDKSNSAEVTQRINSALKKAGVDVTASQSTISGNIEILTKSTGISKSLEIKAFNSKTPADLSNIDFSEIKGKVLEVNINGKIKRIDLTAADLPEDEVIKRINKVLEGEGKAEVGADGKIKLSTLATGNGNKISAVVRNSIVSDMGTDTEEATITLNLDDLKNKKTSFIVNGKSIELDLTKLDPGDDGVVDNADIEKKIKDTFGTALDINFNGNDVEFKTKTTGMEQEIKVLGEETQLNNTTATEGYTDNVGTTHIAKISGKDIKGTIIDTYGNKASFGYGTETPPAGYENDISDKVKGNTFIIDNVKFDISDVTTEAVTLTGKADTSELMKTLKTFVEDYNKITAKVDKMINEKKQYSYQPLTDEQKKEMSEEEIKLWNEKCKQGLLKRDDILSGIQRDLREAFMTPVAGSNLSLNSIGISFSDDYITKSGQLVINEEKLSKALEENSDDVLKMFTTIPDSSVAESDKYKNTGIMQRVKTIINDTAISSTSDLVKKAGYEGKKEYDNELYKSMQEKEKQIKDLEKMVKTKENAYYLQFANLEKVMNQLNSQQSWLMQQFGG